MNNKQILDRLKGLRITDWLVFIVAFWLIIVASPYIAEQFKGLVKAGDIFWNFALDLVVLHLGFIAVWMLVRGLRLLTLWFDRTEKRLKREEHPSE